MKTKKKPGPKPLPPGKKRVLKAFKLRPDLIGYLERKGNGKDYKNPSKVAEAAIELMMSLEP